MNSTPTSLCMERPSVLQPRRHRRAHRARGGVLPPRARARGEDVPGGRRGDAVRGADERLQRRRRGERRARRRAHRRVGRDGGKFRRAVRAGADM
eukprot:21943-Pelagococcus_subviridis.AAC.4